MVQRAGLIGAMTIAVSWLMVSSVTAQQPIGCTQNCATISAVGGQGSIGGDPVTVTVSY